MTDFCSLFFFPCQGSSASNSCITSIKKVSFISVALSQDSLHLTSHGWKQREALDRDKRSAPSHKLSIRQNKGWKAVPIPGKTKGQFCNRCSENVLGINVFRVAPFINSIYFLKTRFQEPTWSLDLKQISLLKSIAWGPSESTSSHFFVQLNF